MNRRNFLKVMLAGTGAAIAPAVFGQAFTKPEPNTLRTEQMPGDATKLTFNLGPYPARDYTFSTHCKKVGADAWHRVSKTITLEDDMDLIVDISLNKGDLVTRMQVDEVRQGDSGYACNYFPYSERVFEG